MGFYEDDRIRYKNWLSEKYRKQELADKMVANLKNYVNDISAVHKLIVKASETEDEEK